jgi:hypothetical protein
MATRADPVSLGVVGREEGNPDGGKPESPEHLEGLPDGVALSCYPQTLHACKSIRLPKRVMLAVGFGLRRSTQARNALGIG